MKRFIAVCITVCLVGLAPGGHVQAFGGQGGGHGGHFGGHRGGHGGHFGGHFGGHRGGHGGHFGHFPHGRTFHHPGGFPHKFGHGGFFSYHHGFGRSFAPFAFRAGPPIAIIKDPFFCFPHGLGFTEQDTFVTHLHTLHGISPGRAAFSLIQTGGRLIFLGF